MRGASGLFRMTERIALFIDGSNFHQTVKGLGFDIDYKRLLSEFGRRGRIVRALNGYFLP
jgi:uncharacterized LabA/DUF88 family protein